MAFNTFFSKTMRKREAVGSRRTGKKERSKTGFEVEFLMIDREGDISNDADKVLSYIKNKDLKHDVVKECTPSFLEMGVYPQIYVRNVATRFLEDMLGVLDIAEKHDLAFYPFAMYPYKYTPKMRTGGWYGVKEKIFGEKWELAGRCAGFHFHYSLPSGIFSYEDRTLVDNAHRSEKQKTINSYNFGIAIDSALTTFTQSSPIYQGKYLAKDSRMLLYRGGDALKYDGLYSKYPMFGALQPYVITYEQFHDIINQRSQDWIDLVSGVGGDVKEVEQKNPLDISWNPIKINKVGSVELRNMDMNMPSVLMAISILTKYALRDIQREEIEIMVDNLAIEKPFEFEDAGVQRIYVPPFSHVNTAIQYEAAWKGLESDIVFDYCKRFFSLCLRFTNKKYYPALKPIKKMLKNRRTVSDEILLRLKKAGYERGDEIPNEDLKPIVLHYSKKLRRDIEDTDLLMKSLTESDRTWL